MSKSEDGWWTGEKDGIIGHFPSMLVKELTNDRNGDTFAGIYNFNAIKSQKDCNHFYNNSCFLKHISDSLKMYFRLFFSSQHKAFIFNKPLLHF